MHEGYIKLYRSLLDKPYINKPDYLAVWIHLLLLANHKDTSFVFNNKTEVLKAGQLITGRKKLSEITGIKETQVYKILNYLEMEHQIKQQKNNKFTIITILNWQKYQGNITTKEQVKEQPSDNQATTKRQPSDTYNNVNNVKNEKNINNNIYSPNNKYSDDSIEIELAKLLFEEIKKRDPNSKEPNFQKWAVHIDRLIRLDKRAPTKIREVILWCQQDSFWKNNILSTEKLREKFQQLLLKMDSNITQPKSWNALKEFAKNKDIDLFDEKAGVVNDA